MSGGRCECWLEPATVDHHSYIPIIEGVRCYGHALHPPLAGQIGVQEVFDRNFNVQRFFQGIDVLFPRATAGV